MRIVSSLFCMSAAAFLLAGCSGEPEVASDADSFAHTSATNLDAGKETDSKEETEGAKEYVAPFPEKMDLFAPPKMMPVAVEEEEEEVVHDFPKPPVELLGFVNVGSPKAMLSFEGDTRILGVGEKHRNLQVVAVEFPTVRLKHRWTEFDLNLFAITSQADNKPAEKPAQASPAELTSQLPDFPTVGEDVPLQLNPEASFLEAE